MIICIYMEIFFMREKTHFSLLNIKSTEHVVCKIQDVPFIVSEALWFHF